MNKDLKHWANNFAGMFLVSVTMFVVALAVGGHFTGGAGSGVLWFLGLLGLVSLAGWMLLAFMAGGSSGRNVLFDRR